MIFPSTSRLVENAPPGSASVVFVNGVTWPSRMFAELGDLALKLKPLAPMVRARGGWTPRWKPMTVQLMVHI
jgi:hypothetical protein